LAAGSTSGWSGSARSATQSEALNTSSEQVMSDVLSE
jgi:hypothetical protein